MKRRKDGLFQKQTTVKLRNGDKKRITVYGRTARELEKKKRDAVNDLILNGPIRSDTVATYVNKWLATIEKRVSAATYSAYVTQSKKILARFGKMPIQKIKASDVQAFFDEYSDHASTAEHLRVVLSNAFKLALADEIVFRNPFDTLAMPKKLKKEKRPLTDNEKSALASAALDPEERLFVDLLYYTGMRRGEVLALHSDDIDLEAGAIHVRHTLSYPDNDPVLKTPKTAKSVRFIPIPGNLSLTLKKSDIHGFLFASEGFMTKGEFQALWDRILKKLNAAAADPITDLTPHIFRHNYATTLVNSDVPIKEAQVILGHNNIATTMDIYAHVDHASDATVSKLNSAFSGTIKPVKSQ